MVLLSYLSLIMHDLVVVDGRGIKLGFLITVNILNVYELNISNSDVKIY